ncbi:MAG: hypothetical protein JWN74_3798 [Acidobacteriaceae bacterium]|nr:hypothetical protein [Acidobacteriaceae bacterium]
MQRLALHQALMGDPFPDRPHNREGHDLQSCRLLWQGLRI